MTRIFNILAGDEKQGVIRGNRYWLASMLKKDGTINETRNGYFIDQNTAIIPDDWTEPERAKELRDRIKTLRTLIDETEQALRDEINNSIGG